MEKKTEIIPTHHRLQLYTKRHLIQEENSLKFYLSKLKMRDLYQNMENNYLTDKLYIL